MKTVKVVRVPGVAKEVVLEDNAVAADAVRLYCSETDTTSDNLQIRRNDCVIENTTPVVDGDKLYLVPQIKGNC